MRLAGIPLAGPGPGKVVISVKEDEGRRSEPSLLVDLMKRVEDLREDLIRARTEADEGLAEARECPRQVQPVISYAERTSSRVGRLE